MANAFSRPPVILMADDDETERSLAAEAAAECYPEARFVSVDDGVQLMSYLLREGSYADPVASPRPGVILLDLHMPGKSGWEVLRELKANGHLRRIPVVALTQYSDEDSVLRGYDEGVNAFIAKPLNFNRLCEIMRSLGYFWFNTAQLARAEGSESGHRRPSRWER